MDQATPAPVAQGQQAQASGGPASAPPTGDASATPARSNKSASFGVFFLLVAAAGAAGVAYWLHSRNFASTDDAAIDGHVSQIAAETGGRVLRLLVNDNQPVKAGQVLLEIDPADARIALARADAQLATARATIAQADAQLAVSRATAAQAAATADAAQADLAQADTDLSRYRRISAGAITRQTLDTAGTLRSAAAARAQAARHAAESAAAQVKAAQAQVESARASLAAAEAEDANAQLTLSRTRLIAPVAGRIAKRSVEAGQVVSAGTPLLAIVQPDLWVTANFKETQLARIRPGQSVTIEVDALPGTPLTGHVESFQPGTGSVFSALPAENATGNYVKVVQRVPVKIIFDGDAYREAPLAPGMSVIPRVSLSEPGSE